MDTVDTAENAVDRRTFARPSPEAPWLKYYADGVPHFIARYQEVPLYTWLDEAADIFPRNIACSYYNNTIRYSRLRRDAEICAANLRLHGVNPGDRVGIMLPNLPQTLFAFWGVLKTGAVVTMINPLYMEKEIVHLVGDSGLKHIITFDMCWPKLEKLRDRLGVERYFVTSVAEGLSFPLNLALRFKNWREKSIKPVPFDNRQVLPFSDLFKGSERLCEPVKNPREDLALLQYTGGTTGLAKGAMLSHFNVAANIQQIARMVPQLEHGRETFVAVLPFFHVYGLNTCLILPTFFQSRVVPVTRFVPSELLPLMKKCKATALPGAPAIYISLLQQKHKDKAAFAHLKLCISGSAPIPVETQRQFHDSFGVRVIEGYGLSEASPITHLTPVDGLRKAGSIGVPIIDTEARIVDMEFGSLPLGPGKVGELIVRGPQVMRGYWNQPDETASTLRNGWLYTGDIASMDEEGFFTIVDRKKDMILVAGFNVSPREIDEVLYEHPKVRDAVSVGVPHPARGEVIKAYIVLKDGEHCERSEIIAWCRERLANYKIPRMVEFRDELPKSLVGKILRRVLREEEEAKLKQRGQDASSSHLGDEPCFDGDLLDESGMARTMDGAGRKAAKARKKQAAPQPDVAPQPDPALQGDAAPQADAAPQPDAAGGQESPATEEEPGLPEPGEKGERG